MQLLIYVIVKEALVKWVHSVYNPAKGVTVIIRSSVDDV